DIITYTLSYTNKASGLNTATGVQLSDTLPPQIVVDPNNIPAGGVLVGNIIYWDLTNLTIRAGGQITFPAQVSPNAGFGVSFTNSAQVLSAENDLNYSDDTSTLVTTTVGCAQPSVSSSPASLTRCSGDSITFTPVVNGTGPMTYQWLKNGSNIPGETGSSCTIAAISTADAGAFSVVITNLCGSATSVSTTLIVNTNVSAT